MKDPCISGKRHAWCDIPPGRSVPVQRCGNCGDRRNHKPSRIAAVVRVVEAFLKDHETVRVSNVLMFSLRDRKHGLAARLRKSRLME